MSEVERGRGVLARKDVTTERCRGMKKKKMGDVHKARDVMVAARSPEGDSPVPNNTARNTAWTVRVRHEARDVMVAAWSPEGDIGRSNYGWSAKTVRGKPGEQSREREWQKQGGPPRDKNGGFSEAVPMSKALPGESNHERDREREAGGTESIGQQRSPESELGGAGRSNLDNASAR
ncbi:hypothetical protein B0H14DRAFT_3137380 [Mycena olivaceomarginata]|nr:hypothetical protein B0H14DRAFT_3137380 [Mycena olivaceomarginata]